MGVDDLVMAGLAWGAARGAAAIRGSGARAGGALAGRRLRLVHRLAELHRELGERIGLGGDRAGIVAAGDGAQLGDRRLDRGLVGGGHLVAALLDRTLGGIDQRLGLVPRLDQGALLLVLLGMRLGVLDRALDVGVAEPARGLDADLDRKSVV